MPCRRFVWLVLALLAGASLPGASVRAADVTKFDVAGLRLYMSGEEVMNALEKTFGKSAADEQCTVKTADNPYYPGSHLLMLITCNIPPEVFRTRIWFVPSIPPHDDEPEAAYFIEYARYTATKNDIGQLYQAAIKKYGPPDTNLDRIYPYPSYPRYAAWCSPPVKTQAECDRKKGPLLVFSGDGTDPDGVYLSDLAFRDKATAAAENAPHKPRL